MATTQQTDPQVGEVTQVEDPDNVIVVEDAPQQQQQAPAQPARQPRSGTDPQTFSAEEVERIRQEERARYSTLTGEMDTLQAELAKYRTADDERAKEEAKRQREIEKAEKKKAEEEMELRELITKKDEEWEQKLQGERQERERALALLEQERRHAGLQNYLAQKMMEHGEEIAPQLRKLVAGNTEEEIDAKIAELVEISTSILGDTQQYLAQQQAARPTVGVTSPPVGPADMAAETRTYTTDDLRAMPPEEYAQHRESLLRAASQSRRQ